MNLSHSRLGHRLLHNIKIFPVFSRKYFQSFLGNISAFSLFRDLGLLTCEISGHIYIRIEISNSVVGVHYKHVVLFGV
jgi:hypothetical protein